MRDAYMRVLAKRMPKDKQRRTYIEAMAEQIVIAAVKGDVRAVQEITDRLDGKAVQAVALSGEGGGPIPFADVSPAENLKRIAELVSKGRGKGGIVVDGTSS